MAGERVPEGAKELRDHLATARYPDQVVTDRIKRYPQLDTRRIVANDGRHSPLPRAGPWLLQQRYNFYHNFCLTTNMLKPMCHSKDFMTTSKLMLQGKQNLDMKPDKMPMITETTYQQCLRPRPTQTPLEGTSG